MLLSYLYPSFKTLICIIGMVATAVADFAPQVHWSCSSSTVSVFVQSPSPFKGLISTKEATANECRSVGVGSNVAVLKLALRNNHCGVRYNNELDQYMVTIEIHTHSIVIVDEDVVLNVTCRGNRKSSTNVPTREKLTLSVRENRAGRSVGEVLHANPYTLAVESTSTEVNFRVGNCSLRSENYSSIELTDSRGCALYPSLLTDFKSAGNGWYAAISPMFRFPSSARITFSCHVLRCRGECTTYPCGERNSVTRRSGTETIILAESLHTTVLLRDKPEAATLMQAYEQASQANTDCDMSNDNGMMCILCIILSACSLLGFAIELVLYILLSKSSYGKRDENKLSTQISDEFRLSDPRVHESSCSDNRRNSSISDSSMMRSQSPNRVSILMEYSKASGRSTDLRRVFCCAEINPTGSFTPTRNPDPINRVSEEQAISYL